MESDFSVTIGEATIDLGRQILHTPIAEVVGGSVVRHEGHWDCEFRSVEGTEVTIRLTGAGG